MNITSSFPVFDGYLGNQKFRTRESFSDLFNRLSAGRDYVTCLIDPNDNNEFIYGYSRYTTAAKRDVCQLQAVGRDLFWECEVSDLETRQTHQVLAPYFGPISYRDWDRMRQEKHPQDADPRRCMVTIAHDPMKDGPLY